MLYPFLDSDLFDLIIIKCRKILRRTLAYSGALLSESSANSKYTSKAFHEYTFIKKDRSRPDNQSGDSFSTTNNPARPLADKVRRLLQHLPYAHAHTDFYK